MDSEDRDFATLCICALRYCMGRKTCMPSLVQEIVLRHIDNISDGDLKIILEDLNRMNGFDYGDPVIDKPDWLNFKKAILDEIEKRSMIEDEGVLT